MLFANHQEFHHGSLEEQEISTACKALIQNATVLWNALSLSQQLLNIDSTEERDDMISAIAGSSLLTWQHVDLQVEYDFRRQAANDGAFDMGKILALRFG